MGMLLNLLLKCRHQSHHAGRRTLRMSIYRTALIFVFCVATTFAQQNDWPQWRGPDRSGVSKETGLLKSWPSSGPTRLWSISGLGNGFGTVAIKGDRIYVQGTQKGKSVVHALNRTNGAPLWICPLGGALSNERGGGPRGTPTVDGEFVYALTEAGDLACMRRQDGSVVWSRNILKDFSARNIEWLISESPLVDGNNVIVTPGGSKACIVALDKTTGKTVWTSKELNDPAGYASCVAADILGSRVITTLTSSAAVGVQASDGRLIWRYGPAANSTANVATPIVSKSRMFYTSNYGAGCVLLEFILNKDEYTLRKVYDSKDMMNHHGGVVLVDGYIYGFSNSILTCLNFDSGKVAWKNRSVGKGSLTYADGNLYLLSESNVVGLAEASPAGYVEKGRFKIEDKGWPSWAHPVVCGGKLYIRNQESLNAYNIAAGQQ